MKALVVYNPSAGRGRGDAIAAAVERNLGGRGFDTERHATQGPNDAVEVARRCAAAADVIVAVGGDGTINEVVNGMAQGVADAAAAEGAGSTAAPAGSATAGGRRAALGIVPAGTVNVFALELGLPSQIERACEVIAHGKTRLLDLGRANERRFTLMVGAGVDALTIRDIDLRAKRRFKELAFVGTGIRSGLAADPPPFLVRAGGREYEATFFVAGNCHYYAAHLSMTPGADPTDGLLDLLIFTGTTRASLAVMWLELPAGLHVRNANVVCMRAERAEVLPLGDPETVWFQTDGEVAGHLPVQVEIDAHALEVLVP